MDGIASTGDTQFAGPPHVPVLGWRYRGLQMLSDPGKFLLQMYKRYGEVSALDPDDPSYLFVASGRYIKSLLSEPDDFVVDGFKLMKPPLGSSMARLARGVLSLNGVEHRRHRKVLMPAFRRQNFKNHLDPIVDTVRNELDRWQFGESRRIDLDFKRLVAHISIRTMFGIHDPVRIEKISSLLRDLLERTGSTSAMILPYSIPGTPYWRMLKAAEMVEKEIGLLIDERRDQSAVGNDFLSMLVAAYDEQGCELPATQIFGDAYTALCHSTISPALQWTLFLLDRHREVRDEIVEEIHSVVRQDAPTPDELDRLDLLDAVIKESLRLFPPSAISTRYAVRDCRLGPYSIAKDTSIMFSHYVTHRMSAVFPEPLRFKPDRWFEASPDPYDYAPFGAGAHICIAKYFATEEIKVILVMIMKRMQLSLPNKARVDRGMQLALVPKNGLLMRVDPVNSTVDRAQLVGNVLESVELA